jgi:two-component system sensor histidine kinase/response regulator
MSAPHPDALRVLLVSPDPVEAELTVAMLAARARHLVERVEGPAEALEALARGSFDAVLLDRGLEAEQAHALVRQLHAAGFGGAFIVLAPEDDDGDELAGLHFGAADFLVKHRVTAERLTRSLRFGVRHARVVAELERRNAELERFAAAVSHDLRQPLHLVSGYAELLEACCDGQLGPDALHALSQIRFGAERMNELIEDLLVYARLERGRKEPGPVDTRFVLELVERELAEPIRRSGAEIRAGMLPVIHGHRPLLEQLLRNLVGNAIKFAGASAPRVFVGAESRGDRWLFCVRDQGPGIPAAYHDCLFEMFTRGPQRDEVPGTGIGLAVCKKAVDAHRGRIWIESEPGQGTTFWFTLPRRNGEGAHGGQG